MAYVSYDQAMADAQRAVAERARREAAERAAARNDYWVSLPGPGPLRGPFSEREMRDLVADAVALGRKPLVLKAVEDYGR